MADEFGTPDAQDATSMHEKTVREAGEYAASLDIAVKENVQNRPLGSVKVSPAQRRQEFDAMKDNTEHLAKFFTDQEATVEEMVQYLVEMNKK